MKISHVGNGTRRQDKFAGKLLPKKRGDRGTGMRERERQRRSRNKEQRSSGSRRSEGRRQAVDLHPRIGFESHAAAAVD